MGIKKVLAASMAVAVGVVGIVAIPPTVVSAVSLVVAPAVASTGQIAPAASPLPAGAPPVQAPFTSPAAAVVDGSIASLPNGDPTPVSSLVNVPTGVPAVPPVPPTATATKTKGFDPATSVEDPLGRSAFNTTFHNADGTETAQMYTTPVNFLDARGNWQKVDNHLVSDGAGGLTNAANRWHVTFKPMTAGGGIVVDTPDGTLTYMADGAAPVAPVVEPDGASVRYPEVLPGTDLLFKVMGGSVEEFVVLKSANATPTVTLTMSGANLDTIPSGFGGRGSSALAKRVNVSAPVTFDATGKEVDPLSQVFTASDVSSGVSKLTVGLSKSALAQMPASAFPVSVDPNLSTAAIGASRLEAYAYFSDTGAAYSSPYPFTNGYAYVGNPTIANKPTVRWRTVAFFDYSAIQVSSVVDAKLTTTVVGGTTAINPLNIWWANQWGNHWATPARAITQDEPPIWGWTNSWGHVYSSQSMGGGTSTFQNDLHKLYNDFTRLNQPGGAILLTGSETAGQYTVKQFTVSLQLTYNWFPNVPTLYGSSSGHTLTLGTVSPTTDPDGDPVLYNHYVYAGGTLVWQSGWIGASRATYVAPAAYWNSTLTYGTEVWDSQFIGGEYHVRLSSPATSVWTPDQPPAAATANSPNSQVLSGTLQPTFLAHTATAPDPDLDTVTYTIQVCDSSIYRGTASLPVAHCSASAGLTAAANSDLLWPMPSNTLLKWGQTYSWWIRASDGVQYTDSTAQSFLTANSAGTTAAIGFGVQPNMRGVAEVNTANGNFTYIADDLSTPGMAMPLGLTRAYNSKSTTTGGFGTGWASSWEYSLQTVANGVNFNKPDGSVVFFGLNSDGTYQQNAFGDGSSLTTSFTAPAQIVGATRAVTNNEATTFYFSTTGAYLGLQTATGRVMTLTVTGNTQTVTDIASGRSIFIDWNATPAATGSLIASVRTAPLAGYGNTPIQWRYYYGVNQFQACDPRNNTQTTGDCTTYNNDANGRITSIVLPKGNTQAALTYDANGRVLTRKDGYNNTWTYAYTTNVNVTNLQGAPQTIPFRTTVTDPLGHIAVYDSDTALRTIHVDNQQDQPLWQTYTAGGYTDTTSVGTTAATAVTDVYGHQANGLVNLHTDPNNTTSTTSYYSTSLVNTHTAPTGEITTITQDATAMGQPSLITSSAQPNVSFTYTGTTDQVPGLPGVYQPANLVKTVSRGTAITTYTYNAAGDVLSVASSSGATTSYTYDEIGRKLSETLSWSGNTAATTYTYDQLGEQSTVTQPRVQNQVTGQWHQLRTSTSFDTNTNPWQVALADIEPAAGGFTPDATRTTTAEYDLNDRSWRVTDPEGAVSSATWDAAGNLKTITDALGRVTETFYDNQNRPTSVVVHGYIDPTNPGVARDITQKTVLYDALGRESKVTDANGNTVQTDYAPNGLVLDRKLLGFVPRTGAAVDVALEQYTYEATTGRVLHSYTANNTKDLAYAYDSQARVTTSTFTNAGSVNRITGYTYDAATGQIASALNANSTEGIQTTYDVFGRPTKKTVLNGPNATDGLATLLGHDPVGNTTSVTDPNGNVTTTDFDLLGRPWRVTQPTVTNEIFNQTAAAANPAGLTGYDTFGDVTQVKDPAGNITSSSYDRNGHRTVTAYPSYMQPGTGTVLTPTDIVHYDAVGKVDYRIDRRGQRTDYAYDVLNRPAITTYPAANTGDPRGTSQVRYDDIGNVIWTKDPTGAVVQHSYDKLSRVRTTTEVVRHDPAAAENDVTTFDYDWAGNQTTVIDPTGTVVATNTYSPAGELLTHADAASAVATNTYNDQGLITSTTDPQGRTTRYMYDPSGRTLTIGRYPTAAATTATTSQSFGYDRNGNRITVTDANSHISTYTFDPLNRPVTVIQPFDAAHSATTSYGYDLRSLQTRATDPNGNQWWTTFNTWGLEESRIEPSTTGQTALTDRTFTRTYDAGAGLTSELKPGPITVTHTLDNLGRVKTDNGGTAGGTRGLSYDLDNRPTTITSGTTSLTLGYNDRSQLAQVIGSAGTSSFQYDTVGRITHRTDAAGDTVYAWNTRSLLNTLDDPLTASRHTFAYSTGSDLSTDTITNGTTTLTRTYTYDTIGRPATDTLANGATTISSLAYAFDPAGNITTKTVGPAGALGAGTNTYTYDWSNRLTNWTAPGAAAVAYAYDANGNLTTNGTVTNTYDSRNRQLTNGTTTNTWTTRGTLNTSTTAGVATTNTFDGLDRLTANGTVTYTYDGLDRAVTRNGVAFQYSGLALQPSNDGTNLTSRTPGGLPAATKQATTAATLLLDLHGDITRTINTPAATIFGATTFDPWGKPTVTSGTSLTNLGYQSGYTDPTSKLVDMAARWYTPTASDFIARDSYTPKAGASPAWNRYAYANGNPILNTDPTGHCAGAFIDGLCLTRPSAGIPRSNVGASGTSQRAAGAAGAPMASDPSACDPVMQFTHGCNTFFNSPTPPKPQGGSDLFIWAHQYKAMPIRGDGFAGLLKGLTPSLSGAIQGLSCAAKWGCQQSAMIRALLHPGATARSLVDADICLDSRRSGECTGRYVSKILAFVAMASAIDAALSGASATEAASGASNAATAPALARQLAGEEASSIFTSSGGLQQSVIDASREIIPGTDLSNGQLIKTLTADGSSIADWGKFSTPTFNSPSGPFQVHFYMNPSTGIVHYLDDFKVVFNGAR